ncbi:MAG TPA: CAP domain-containing protein, partial [Actinomycetota bacterium]|nr:CAP domain-containing protein [Actinomycetota bacterium]
WRDVRLSPWGAVLNDRARAHTLAMRDAGRIFHSSYRPCWYRGENVGVVGGGDGALRRIFRAFMDSKAHRSIILDPLFSRVGIGVAVGGGFVWVTMIFCA